MQQLRIILLPIILISFCFIKAASGEEGQFLHAGWFSDDTPEECIESNIGSCNTQACRVLVNRGCQLRFSQNELEEKIGKCELRHSDEVDDSHGIKAVIIGCRYNEKCALSGMGAVGACLLNNIEEVQGRSLYLQILRRCKMIADKSRRYEGDRPKPGC
jgi:hypothetical protein